MRLKAILTVVLLGAALLTGVATARTAAVPQNTSPPTISGTAREGNTLTARNGTWANSPTSFAYQWQRCTSSTTCTNVDGATARTYGVRSADVGDTLRVAVTAHNSSGSTATASSDQTATVTGNTTTVVTTVRGNHAPSLTFLSLRRVGTLVYSRFRVCDDSTARVNVTERDTKPGVLAYTRHFLVHAKPCATYSRHWGLAARFRH